jgi:hypothetical protein
MLPSELLHFAANHQEHFCQTNSQDSVNTQHNHCNFNHFQLQNFLTQNPFFFTLLAVLLFTLSIGSFKENSFLFLFYSANRGPPQLN